METHKFSRVSNRGQTSGNSCIVEKERAQNDPGELRKENCGHKMGYNSSFYDMQNFKLLLLIIWPTACVANKFLNNLR
ncbi:MAG: hypothetical protein MJE68_09715, partial [Proteobacteria bacterium]|nr:hypothetical protein [Pseudomonadota bacterium]